MERHSFRTVSGESLAKLCGNCDFPQNFHTMKLGEITVFDSVIVDAKHQNCEHDYLIEEGDYPFRIYEKFSEKLRFLVHRYARVIRNFDFQKILRTY